MSEKSGVILLPEGGQPVIDAVGEHNTTGYPVEVTAMPLLGEDGQPGALEQLVDGKYAAVIAGARHSSAAVIKAGLEAIGAEDGLISSFFAMESKQHPDNRVFLADCAVVPTPTKDVLLKIAEQTCTSVEKLGIKPVVAFISAAQDGTRSVVHDAHDAFVLENPARTTVGVVRWDEATDEHAYLQSTGAPYPEGQKPNVFVLPELNTGNIVYKVLQDPDGTGWTTKEDRDDNYLLEKSGRQIVLSKYTKAESPTSDELVQLAESACTGVDDPIVAFLSFSTEGSSKHESAQSVQNAAEQFRQQHPAITTYGEIQWDSARVEDIYALKTGSGYRDGKAPNVFIFPNRDSGDTVYRIMGGDDTGGLTAVGPMLQGWKNDILLIDLSRGVDEEAALAVVKLTGQLAGLSVENAEATHA